MGWETLYICLSLPLLVRLGVGGTFSAMEREERRISLQLRCDTLFEGGEHYRVRLLPGYLSSVGALL